jgi:hypothetical protein
MSLGDFPNLLSGELMNSKMHFDIHTQTLLQLHILNSFSALALQSGHRFAVKKAKK